MASDENGLCVILGGGGHARVLIDSLQAAGSTVPCVILDANSSRRGATLLGVEVAGGDELLPELIERGAQFFVVAVGSTGDARPRRALYELGLSHGLQPLTVRHPSAVCSPWASAGAGLQLLPLSVVNAGARLGDNVIVNTGAIVEHDCEVGDHAHVATGARLASTVRIGAGAHVGAGAIIRQGITVGDGAVIGAGAVVVRDVEARTVVVGVPARFLREAAW